MDPRTVHDPDSSWLRMRVWQDGRILDEQWIDALDPGAYRLREEIANRHYYLARRAQAYGESWAVEVYDPARPPEYAFLRYSSDDPPERVVQIVAGMRDPTTWHGGQVE